MTELEKIEEKDNKVDIKTVSSELERLMKFTSTNNSANVSDIEPTDEDLKSIEKKNHHIIDGELQWANKLSNSGDNDVTFSEFGKQTYKYIHVKNPVNKNTGYFTCHCNVGGQTRILFDSKNRKLTDETGQPMREMVWVTKNGMLSKHYNVASMESLVDYLKEKLDIKEGIELWHQTPFYLTWKGRIQSDFDIFKTPEVKEVFECVSGIDTTQFSKINCGVDLYILNCYSGNSAVIFDFVINMTLQNSAGEVKTFKDFFTLANKQVRLTHKGSLDSLTRDALNFNLDITKEIDIMSDYIITNSMVESICNKLQNKYRQDFMDEWSQLPGPNKNLFYTLLLTSSYLGEDYTSDVHSDLIKETSKLIKNATKEYNKKMKELETETSV